MKEGKKVLWRPMKKFRLVYRLSCFILFILVLTGFSVLVRLSIRNQIYRQKKLSSFSHLLSSIMLTVLGCKIKTKGLEHLKKNQTYLITANHVSYLDIVVLYKFIKHSRFISYMELRESDPFLNLIISAGGAYFVEKRNLKNIRKELKETTAILKNGLNLIFFPEGTSTDGSEIKPFHSLFFATIKQGSAKVLPTCINYTKIENKPLSLKNRDLICWYDDRLSFTQHLFRLLQLKSITVELLFLPSIDSTNKTSRQLAEESRKQIQHHFKPYMYD